MGTLSVSSLNNQIKSLLETTFLHVNVEGEVSRITYHGSGHLYFTLKDRDSAISCVMFRGNNMKMKFRLEEGMAVVLHGSVSVYAPRGNYQINVTKIEPAGEGALALAYEQLKKALHVKGYFENKKPIPKVINHIALVTSGTGAALQDMLRVAQKRWPLVKITLLDTVVQGEGCGEKIAYNIQKADALHVDVIVVGRGGGSMEDLWGFNEEVVADAIYFATTPIVSAVGHEIDYVISDFVADLRAPTPSAAMEMILPDSTEMILRLDEMRQSCDRYMMRILHMKNESIKSFYKMFKTHSYDTKLELQLREIGLLRQRYSQILDLKLKNNINKIRFLKSDIEFATKNFIYLKEKKLLASNSSMEANNPSKGLRDGYAQIVRNQRVVPLEFLQIDDIIELQTSKKTIMAKVIK